MQKARSFYCRNQIHVTTSFFSESPAVIGVARGVSSEFGTLFSNVMDNPESTEASSVLRQILRSSKTFQLRRYNLDEGTIEILGKSGVRKIPMDPSATKVSSRTGGGDDDDDDDDDDDNNDEEVGFLPSIRQKNDVLRKSAVPPDTSKWTKTQVRRLGFCFQTDRELSAVLPHKYYDQLPSDIQALHEQLPSIEEEDPQKRNAAIIAACQKKIELNLGLTRMLARQMQDIASSSGEPPVDRLLGSLLDIVTPGSLRVDYKPLLTFTATTARRNVVLYVARPDYGIRPTSCEVEFVSLASGANREGVQKLGQLAGQGLLAALVNYSFSRAVFPVPVFQLRGTYLSVGLVYASKDYMEALKQGYTHGGPAAVHLFTPKLEGRRSEKGYDLMRKDEREEALLMILNTMTMVDQPKAALNALSLPVMQIAQREWESHNKK